MTTSQGFCKVLLVLAVAQGMGEQAQVKAKVVGRPLLDVSSATEGGTVAAHRPTLGEVAGVGAESVGREGVGSCSGEPSGGACALEFARLGRKI